MALAICLVSLSWTWSLRLNISAILASLLRPSTLLLGMYPMETFKFGGDTKAKEKTREKKKGSQHNRSQGLVADRAAVMSPW